MTDLNILDQPVVTPSFELWGQVSVAVWQAALVKGQGKVPYDPKVHDRMFYAIDLSVVPITLQNSRIAERSLLQSSKEWKLIQESIKACGVQPSEIDGKYVRVKFEPTGEVYTNASGETKNKTYMHFVKVFNSVEECEKDFQESSFNTNINPVTEIKVASTQQSQPSTQQAQTSTEYETALRFLGAAVRSAAKGKTKDDLESIKKFVGARIQGSPLMSKYFTEESDKVNELILQELGL
jgi:hypothetical protein